VCARRGCISPLPRVAMPVSPAVSWMCSQSGAGGCACHARAMSHAALSVRPLLVPGPVSRFGPGLDARAGVPMCVALARCCQTDWTGLMRAYVPARGATGMSCISRALTMHVLTSPSGAVVHRPSIPGGSSARGFSLRVGSPSPRRGHVWPRQGAWCRPLCDAL